MTDKDATTTGGTATKGPVHVPARSRGAEIPPGPVGAKEPGHAIIRKPTAEDAELVRRVWQVSAAAEKTLKAQDAFLVGMAVGVSLVKIDPKKADAVRKVAAQSGALAAHRPEAAIVQIINGLAEDIVG